MISFNPSGDGDQLVVSLNFGESVKGSEASRKN